MKLANLLFKSFEAPNSHFARACFWASVIAAILFLLIDPTHFNKDDNFSQFTPVFKYAFDAMLNHQFPWISPTDFTVRLAQAPYYALFSPILLLSCAITHLLKLPDYWIVNFWALIHFVLINLVAIRFVRQLKLIRLLQSAVVLSCGSACFAAYFAVNWYYTLPFQLLLLTKIMYWHQALHTPRSDKTNDNILLVVTWLAVMGGNPQLLVYALISEALFLLPNINRNIAKTYARNAAITIVLMAPLIYCQAKYWGTSWRTITNNHIIEIYDFLRIGLLNPLYPSGQSLWVAICIALLLIKVKKFGICNHEQKLYLSLACGAVILLSLATTGFMIELGYIAKVFKSFTTPSKWWFFGSILAVTAVAIWAECKPVKIQRTIAILTWMTGILFLRHSFDKSNFNWDSLDYSGLNDAAVVVSKYQTKNSRAYQVSSDRPTEEMPGKHLILNTWLLAQPPVLMTTGYESVQPSDGKNRFSAFHLNTSSLKNSGISALWVNAYEYTPDEYEEKYFNLAYQDDHNFLLALKDPGEIVTCTYNCTAEFRSFADHIDINFTQAVSGNITVRINPLSNFRVTDFKSDIAINKTSDGWLEFKGTGATQYRITYEDYPFITLLAFSDISFILLLMANYALSHRPRRRSTDTTTDVPDQPFLIHSNAMTQ